MNSHLSTCVGTQSPKYLEMARGHISLSATRAAASSVRAGEGSLRPFAGPPEGGFPALEAAAFARAEALLGQGTAGFAADNGLLLPGAADFTAPRAFFASRKGSPILMTARRF
jgi:hypothetical protein